jgi:hypothetical protein
MRKIGGIFVFVMLVLACKKESLSDEAAVLDYEVTGLTMPSLTLDQVFIDESNRIISLLFTEMIPADSFPISFVPVLSLSPGATSMPASGETVVVNSMEDPVEYKVTAEDGSSNTYYLLVRGDQLSNSDLEDWYTTSGLNGRSYKEPGKDAHTTIWATANSGTSAYNVYGTIPSVSGENTVAEITTGLTSLIPLTAGTLYTGKFDLNGAINNPTNPREATIMGIPFTLRPVAFKFKYTYEPGSRYIKATLNDPGNIFGGFTVEDLEGVDKFTAYAILEVRNGENVVEIARAELSSSEVKETLTEITIPFTYAGSQKPTHLTVLFSSSKDGEWYTGAVGSKLTVDDIELIYE